jgi:hypothetical protein
MDKDSVDLNGNNVGTQERTLPQQWPPEGQRSVIKGRQLFRLVIKFQKEIKLRESFPDKAETHNEWWVTDVLLIRA